MEYPSGQFGTAVPAVSPPGFFPTTSLLTEVLEWDKEKAYTVYKHCSAIAKTLVLLSTQF